MITQKYSDKEGNIRADQYIRCYIIQIFKGCTTQPNDWCRLTIVSSKDLCQIRSQTEDPSILN